MTTKPVVTVGRFTSPDTMASQVRRGVVDLVGAARPSIADPFIPVKIDEGRSDEIRECIGCNICYSGDSIAVPIRCTQNPTMGEEWRKGWHPERIAAKGSDSTVLIVGAGPAGLEAARAAGQRGYKVILAEATRDLGGRVTREAALPGMGEYARVRDYREQALARMPNVEVFRESRLSADDVLAVGADHVAIATGAAWRRDRFDGQVYVPVADNGIPLLTPDGIMAGQRPVGRTLVYDEDGYYMGGIIAAALCAEGFDVTLATPSEAVSNWAGKTSERWKVRTRLMQAGVGIELSQALLRFDGQAATLACAFTGAERQLPFQSVVMVTQRAPNDQLYRDMRARGDLPFTLTRIGDCDAPAIIAAATYAGHRYAQELDAPTDPDQPLRHDRIDVGQTPEGAYLS